MADDFETMPGVFGPVHVCCGVTAPGHDLYCENRPVEAD